MNMYLRQIDDLTSKVSTLYQTSIQSGLVPVITDQGIAIGAALIKHSGDSFLVFKDNHEYYRTYSKSAAMVVARLLLKKAKAHDIEPILDADRKAFQARNDLEIYKHHYELAVKKQDTVKKILMQARFDAADAIYQMAKKKIKESYYNLF